MGKTAISLDIKKLLGQLKHLPDDIQDKVIKRSVRKGANEIKKDAVSNVPVDTGFMKSRVKVRQARKSSEAGQFVFIVNVKSPAHHLIELGTEDREPTKKRVLVFENKNGEMIYVQQVKGVKANPFLGRSYEANKDKVFDIFRTELIRQLNKL